MSPTPSARTSRNGQRLRPAEASPRPSGQRAARYAPIHQRPKTVIVDVDGVIFRQAGRWPDIWRIDPRRDLLPGVRRKFLEWEMKGYRIILTTGRSDNYRALTEQQLQGAGIPYHHLIMSAGMGQRVLINNLKAEEPDVHTAVAVNLATDDGLRALDHI